MLKDLKKIRRAIAEDAQAGISIATATQEMKLLIEHWDVLHEEIRNSLFRSAIICYSRPFTINKWADGTNYTYGTTRLKAVLSVERKRFHDHIIDLRNTMVAHMDIGKLKTDFSYCHIEHESLPLLWSVAVRAGMLQGIKSAEAAKRYHKHIFEILEQIGKNLDEHLNAFLDASWEYPEELNAHLKEAKTMYQSQLQRTPDGKLAAKIPDGVAFPDIGEVTPQLEMDKDDIVYFFLEYGMKLTGNTDERLAHFKELRAKKEIAKGSVS